MANPESVFGFDLDRKPTTTLHPGGLALSRVYDSAGKLDLLQTPAGDFNYDYYGVTPPVGGSPGALSQLTTPQGIALSYRYDGGLSTQQTQSGVGLSTASVSWSYDTDYRVVQETLTTSSGAQTAAFGYDADSLRTCLSLGSCSPAGSEALVTSYDPAVPRATGSTVGLITDTVQYNAYGELADYQVDGNGTLLFRQQLDTASNPRDALGRIVTKTELNGGSAAEWHYSYDLQGRLETVVKDGAQTHAFTYDDNGNRLSLTTPTQTLTGTYDDQDRLLSYGDYAYTYTANGELLTKTNTSSGDVWAYEYDVRGNLVRVDLPSGDVIQYRVDGQNRRVGKLYNGALVKQWVWRRQLSIAAELDAAGTVVSRFVYGSKPTTRELVVRGANTYRVVADPLGSVRALVNVDDVNDVPVRLDYDVFGEVTGSGADVVPQGFAGGLYDADTALVRFGARDYDPVIGRWLSKDPIRFDGGVNLLAYAFGDPINLVDRNGKLACLPAVAAGIGFTAYFIHELFFSDVPELGGESCPLPAPNEAEESSCSDPADISSDEVVPLYEQRRFSWQGLAYCCYICPSGQFHSVEKEIGVANDSCE